LWLSPRNCESHGIALGWESEGPGFKPQRLKVTSDPGLPKKLISDSQP